MSSTIRSVRRATLDDLPKLVELWELEKLPVVDFERRFKEFQVAESDEGEILGAIGLQTAGLDARIHSEAFARFELADELRRRFWERFAVMGQNQGWVRVWTELTSQPWREAGFDPASTEQLAKLPDAFSQVGRGHWHFKQLRVERASGAPSVDAELQLLRMAHQSENERLMRRAKMLRNIGLLFLTALIGWASWWAYKLIKNKDRLPPSR